MREIIVENFKKIKKDIPIIESKIKIKIGFIDKQGKLSIKGNEVSEYVVEQILKAADFGFDVEDALLLKQDGYILEFINIKEHTHRKNLKEVRSRVIGTDGRAKKIIGDLTGAAIVLHGNFVGIIIHSDRSDDVCQALISLIGGAKHSNVFSYLERRNRVRRNFDNKDLGLKEEFE